MFNLRSMFSLTLCTCFLTMHAAEEVVDNEVAFKEPLAEVIFPDIARLSDRFEQSIYGILWNDPDNAFIREEFNKNFKRELERIKQRDGLDLAMILSNLDRAGAKLIKLDSDAPNLSMFQAFLSFKQDGAAEIMKLPALDNAPVLMDADGADEAFMSPDGAVVLSRFGNTLVLSDPEHIEVPAQAAAVDNDLFINVSGKKLIHGIIDTIYKQAKEQPPVKKQHVKDFLGRYDHLTHTVTIKDAGIYEEIDFVGPENSGVQAIDKAFFERLPHNALAVAAVGLNGKELWNDYVLSFLDLVAEAEQDKTAEAMITDINNSLSFLGIDQSIGEIFTGLNGTYFMCVTPSLPYPAISIGIPRSESTDQLINAILVAQFNIIRPPEGKIEQILMPMGVPPLQLGFGKDYWILSTDPIFTNSWLTGTSRGWDKTPTAQTAIGDLNDDPFLVAAMDAKQIITIGQSTLGLAGLAARGQDKERILSLQKLLGKAALLAEANYLVGTQSGTDFHYEMYSLCGSLPVMMAPGAIVGAIRQQQRRRAWRNAQRKQREEMRKQELEKEPSSVDDL